MATSPGTELAVPIRTEQVVAAIVDGAQLPEVESSEDGARNLALAILTAEDADAVLAVFDSASWRDLLDQPVEIHGVKWRRSSFDEGAPVFAIVDATTGEDGARVTLTTSGRSVMAALLRLDQLGAWPQRVKLTESRKPTEKGYKALQLARA